MLFENEYTQNTYSKMFVLSKLAVSAKSMKKEMNLRKGHAWLSKSFVKNHFGLRDFVGHSKLGLQANFLVVSNVKGGMPVNTFPARKIY